MGRGFRTGGVARALLTLVLLGVSAADAQGAMAPVRAIQQQRPPSQPSGTRAAGTTDATSVPPAPRVGRTARDTGRAAFPPRWPFQRGAVPARAARGMAVSDAPLASEAAIEILRRGGNAVDAAVAMAFALAVVYPEAGNLGGGGYMVIHLANGRSAALDFREIAPLAATRDMYVGPDGRVTSESQVGPRASGVPGSVAGLTAALARYGTLPLSRVMAPAIRFAERGFVVDAALAGSLASVAPSLPDSAGGALFRPNGQPIAAGATLRQPALARTLRAIARDGASAFYTGPIAREWTTELRNAGGIITTDDLRRYRPVWRTPIRATYRGHTVLSMPPSSSGGVTLTESLNILEGLAPLPPFGGTHWAHLLGSAYQRAFIDRNSKLGDPDFSPIPVARLLDKRYAARLRATINPTRATPTPATVAAMREGMETTHGSVADARGNAVALTTTLNDLYGSGVYVASAGFFLNDEMDDFTVQPGTPNMYGLVQGEANAIQPGKRMLSAMTPTIVLDANRRVLLVAGSRGGPRIITSTSQVVLNVIEYRMSLADAVSAPRVHHQAQPDSLRLEGDAVTPAVADSLRAMGYTLTTGGIGLVNALMRVGRVYEGMSDPRGRGRALGY